MDLLELYLHSKRNSWSPVTTNRVRTSLSCYGAFALSGNAEAFYSHLVAKKLSAYSIQTMFMTASGFYKYANPGQTSPFNQYIKDNRNVFKNAYQSKPVGKSYEEVKAAISAAEESQEKQTALRLLSGAQRFSESFTSRGGSILGKGGKIRPDFAVSINTSSERRDSDSREPNAPDLQHSARYQRFRRWLWRTCGVKPHALRKLALTRAASRGAGIADLCALGGWNSPSVALRYLQVSNVERLKQFLED